MSQALAPNLLRDKIVALEAVMLRMPQVEIKTTHHFAPGIYMREIFIPKGTTLTGKIHKTEHLNILSQGDLSVMTEDGIKRFKASNIIKSNPGIKRVGFAHEDSVWITVHPNVTDERDVPAIEAALVVDTFDQFLAFSEKPKIPDLSPFHLCPRCGQPVKVDELCQQCEGGK